MRQWLAGDIFYEFVYTWKNIWSSPANLLLTRFYFFIESWFLCPFSGYSSLDCLFCTFTSTDKKQCHTPSGRRGVEVTTSVIYLMFILMKMRKLKVNSSSRNTAKIYLNLNISYLYLNTFYDEDVILRIPHIYVKEINTIICT